MKNITPTETNTVTLYDTEYDDSEQQGYRLGLNVFHATRCGVYHERNEDKILYDEKTGFYGLADGVGGGALGDLAADTLLQYLHAQHQRQTTPDDILRHLKESDKVVKETLAQHQARGASTLVATWFNNEASGYYSHVGDARIYLIDMEQVDAEQDLSKEDLSNENVSTKETAVRVRLSLLTEDQTYEKLGVKIPEGRRADDPIRMIGVGAVGTPSVKSIQLNHQQGLLFCSDGIHKFISLEQMEQICTQYLTETGEKYHDLSDVAYALVLAAVDNHSHDDCSALLVMNYQPEQIRNEHESIQITETVEIAPHHKKTKKPIVLFAVLLTVLLTIIGYLSYTYRCFLLNYQCPAVEKKQNDKPPSSSL